MQPKRKPKKCKQCGKPFFPYTSMTKVCSISCALDYNREHPEEVKSFAKHLEEKEWKQTKKVWKEKDKTHKDWLKDLERVFNAYIRERDRDLGCISCGTKADVEYHAGHYYPAGNYSYLKFDEQNVNKQCGNNCNRRKHGNFPEYTIGLIKKFGHEAVARLARERHLKVKLSIPEIKEKIEYYKQKIKDLKQAA